MDHIVKVFCLLFFILISHSIAGQNFEGSITYKIEAQNPNPEMITDSMWQQGMKEQFGERGHMLKTTYYKGANYLSEIDAGLSNGIQAFNPKDGLIYSWQTGTDSAISLDSKKSLDAFESITPVEGTETILGIECKGVLLKSKLGQMTLWYNPEHFALEADLYKGHIYGHWEQILGELGCLPIKIEQQGFAGHVVMTALSFKEEKLNDEKFEIPTFKEVSPSPMN